MSQFQTKDFNDSSFFNRVKKTLKGEEENLTDNIQKHMGIFDDEEDYDDDIEEYELEEEERYGYPNDNKGTEESENDAPSTVHKYKGKNSEVIKQLLGEMDDENDDENDEDVSSQTDDGEETEQPREVKSRRHMRITMLGTSGSGKTAFLSGVYQTMMNDDFCAYTLTASASMDQALKQVGQIGDIALINRKDYAFAAGTSETTIFPLTLRRFGKAICDFDFTDYAGGDVINILNPKGNISVGAEVLKKQLLNSDVILVFADAYALSKSDDRTIWQSETGASRINTIFNHLIMSMQEKPLTVLFVLTKTDDERISEYLKYDNYSALVDRMMDAFKMISNTACNNVDNNWNFGVIPVSAVGEGNYELKTVTDDFGNEVQKFVVKEGHSPQPYNIDVTIVYAILCVLTEWLNELQEERAQLQQELENLESKDTFFGNLFAKIDKSNPPKEQVQTLETEISKKDEEIEKLLEQVQAIEDTGVRTCIQKCQDNRVEDSFE